MEREIAWLFSEKYNGVATPAFEADVKKLAEGTPLAYLIGHVPFLNTTIHLDSHPLIPRPETEYWTEEVIKTLPDEPVRVLDLCAGSGCIGIAIKKARPDAYVDFAELEAKHHETIRKNLRENGLEDSNSRICDGDLFENITETYDVIVSNPPYIDPVLDRAEQSVKEHEPHEALYGGADGMECIERIIVDSKKHLTEKGVLYIEHEPEQAKEIKRLAVVHGFEAVTLPDQFGTQRWSVLRLTS